MASLEPVTRSALRAIALVLSSAASTVAVVALTMSASTRRTCATAAFDCPEGLKYGPHEERRVAAGLGVTGRE